MMTERKQLLLQKMICSGRQLCSRRCVSAKLKAASALHDLIQVTPAVAPAARASTTIVPAKAPSAGLFDVVASSSPTPNEDEGKKATTVAEDDLFGPPAVQSKVCCS
jgi:hypothetical protein